MNLALYNILRISTYIVGTAALVILIEKTFFHHFSNDDVIILVFVGVILKAVTLRFPPARRRNKT